MNIAWGDDNRRSTAFFVFLRVTYTYINGCSDEGGDQHPQ